MLARVVVNCLKLAHLHWQWCFFLWRNKKKQISSMYFLCFATRWSIGNQENKITSQEVPQNQSFMPCLREYQKFNSSKMLSTWPTKLAKESSTARILQFSMMIQVREKFPAQREREYQSSFCEYCRSSCWYLCPKCCASAVCECEEKAWDDIMKGNVTFHFLFLLDSMYFTAG